MFCKVHLQLFVTLAVLVCFSEQVPQFTNCPDSIVNSPEYNTGCAAIECVPGESMKIVACGLIACSSPDNVIIGDESEVYPGCCARCKD